MARNLYDMGDVRTDRDERWLNQKDDRNAAIVPMGAIIAVLAIAGLVIYCMGGASPSSDRTSASESMSSISARFALCDDPAGDACVLSASRYAFQGHAYHLADIVVPDEDAPLCQAEGELAAQGRQALATMLNGGTFEAHADTADTDPSARILIRDGVSIGQLMIMKGYARPWSKDAVDWCHQKPAPA